MRKCLSFTARGPSPGNRLPVRPNGLGKAILTPFYETELSILPRAGRAVGNFSGAALAAHTVRIPTCPAGLPGGQSLQSESPTWFPSGANAPDRPVVLETDRKRAF